MERNPTPKGMILDICSMRSRAIKLMKFENDYNPLLRVITEEDYYYNEDLKFPSLKDFAALADIKYDKARRQLVKIYNDLCSYELAESIPFECQKTEIWISMSGMYESKTIQIENLPYLPRKGDSMQVPYFKELLGTDYFYVSKVYHELKDNKQHIFISLKYGIYNSYWDLRKSQAEELGELSWHDSAHKSDYQLKEQLDLRPGKAW